MNYSAPRDTIRITALSVVLICPDDLRRRTLAAAIQGQHATVAREFSAYPSINNLKLDEMDCDVVVVDLDSDREIALDLVENLCTADPSITVIAYSRREDPALLVRCMRVGAREFLSDPVAQNTLAEALVRASARRAETGNKRALNGKVLVFWGAKGGTGVTTLASNFAIALKRESAREVALVDLHPQLGDVAVLLGLQPRFTVMDAFRNSDRLDREFVSTLITEHKSGVAVLAAADEYNPGANIENGNLGKLVYILRDQFPYVVVDAGQGLGSGAELLFELADTIYLVTQVDIPSLRNAQRLYAHLENTMGNRAELVLNRFESRKSDIDEDRVSKALGVRPKWKVPNDFAAVRRAQNIGEPVVLENAPISRVLQQMARTACGKAVQAEVKKKFSLFS